MSVVKQCNLKKGFGIVEMMVAVSIFAIVMTISVGALISLLKANATTEGVIQVTNNLSFVLDSMTRDIRTGLYYSCVAAGDIENNLTSESAKSDCTSTNNDALVYTSGRTGKRIGYRYNAGTIEKKVESGPWLQLTSEDIVVDEFKFRVENTILGDSKQTSIQVRLRGHAGDVSDGAEFIIQTTVSPRTLF